MRRESLQTQVFEHPEYLRHRAVCQSNGYCAVCWALYRALKTDILAARVIQKEDADEQRKSP